MASPVKAYRSPEAPVRSVLAALLDARESLGALHAAGARCVVLENGYARLYLPAGPDASSLKPSAEYDRRVDTLMTAFTNNAELFARRSGARSTNLEDHPSLEAGILLLLLHCAEEDSSAERAEPTGTEKLILLADERLEDRAREASALVKRCPMARLAVVGDEEEPENTGLVLLVQDDVARDSALAGLLVRIGSWPCDVMSRYETPAGPIFLPRTLTFDRSVVLAAGSALEALNDPDQSESEQAYCVARMGATRWVFRTDLPTREAREILSDDIAEAGISWRFLDLKHSVEAETRLRETIGEVDPNAGYRLSLHDVRSRVDDGQSLARIQEKIADLGAQAALIRGLRSPQTTLLRFSRAQLPAMADFLSAAPVGDIDAGKILYGFQATADEPGGVHFLLYDPAEVQFERSFLEWTWRARTEDQPIRYWIDPHWAPFYTKRGAGVRSRVFTPKDTVLHPTLHSFAPEDMDAYLRGLIGRRISASDHNAEIRDLLEDPHLAVGLIFSRSREENFDIDIEILDLDRFTPLRQRLDWINDNLLMIDPAFVSQERMSEIAAALYEGRNAADLLAEMDARSQGLEVAAAQSEDGFAISIEGLAQRFAREFSAAVDQSDHMIGSIERVSARLKALETVLGEVLVLSANSEVEGEALEVIAADLEHHSEILEEGIIAKRRETTEFIEAAEKRLDEAQRTLADLKAKIGRVRDDG
jgi:hypothetical protein